MTRRDGERVARSDRPGNDSAVRRTEGETGPCDGRRGASRLGARLRRLVGWRERRSPSDLAGVSAYEQVTRRGLEDLTRDVERIELKVNGILVAVGSALLIETFRAIVK